MARRPQMVGVALGVTGRAGGGVTAALSPGSPRRRCRCRRSRWPQGGPGCGGARAGRWPARSRCRRRSPGSSPPGGGSASVRRCRSARPGRDPVRSRWADRERWSRRLNRRSRSGCSPLPGPRRRCWPGRWPRRWRCCRPRSCCSAAFCPCPWRWGRRTRRHRCRRRRSRRRWCWTPPATRSWPAAGAAPPWWWCPGSRARRRARPARPAPAGARATARTPARSILVATASSSRRGCRRRRPAELPETVELLTSESPSDGPAKSRPPPVPATSVWEPRSACPTSCWTAVVRHGRVADGQVVAVLLVGHAMPPPAAVAVLLSIVDRTMVTPSAVSWYLLDEKSELMPPP